MNGRVDSSNRALLDILVENEELEQSSTITVWIDTAFDGFLVFPKKSIDELGLRQEATADAILADGSQVTLESYVCYIEWLGGVVTAQVIANEGRFPLLGTELLDKHQLVVNYVDRTVAIG